jgi:cytochrome P450
VTAGVGRRTRSALDPLAPDVVDDPYPAYARLRAEGPLCRVGPASWGVTRHADIAALLRDPRLSNSLPEDMGQFGPEGDALRRLLPARADTEHRALHSAMARAFSPARARHRHASVAELARAQWTAAAGHPGTDIVHTVAYRISACVVCDMIGLPEHTAAAIEPWVASLSDAFTPFLPPSPGSEAERALAQFRSLVAHEIELRAGAPRDDLLSDLTALAVADRLPLEDVVDNVCFLAFTGFETTLNMICTGTVALAEHPEEQARLRSDRSLLDTAVEEFIRWDSPIQYTARLVAEPVEVGGRTLYPGRPVFLLLGCANRDEAAFPRADHVDVGRSPNPHVGFGGGPRGCFGATLARVEGRATFGALLDATSWISLAGQPVRRPNALFRTYDRIDVLVEGAP